MSWWRSKLFVFRDNLGQDHISLSLPTGESVSFVRLFQASGPYMPIGLPKLALVGDAAKWMAQQEKKGFSFKQFGSERDINLES